MTCNATIAFQLTPQTNPTQMTITQVLRQYTQLHILNENMHIEILSVMHTYSIMILTTRFTHSYGQIHSITTTRIAKPILELT